MLAIISHAFDQPSETFIRDHVACLAPGDTALVARKGRPPAGFDGPFLALGGKTHSPLYVLDYLVRRALGLARKPRPACMTRRETARLQAFLQRHNVTTVLVEHGHVGAEFADALCAAGVRLFVHFHGHDANILARFPGFAERYCALFAQADGIVVTSTFMADRLVALGCPEAKLIVCPVGIDTRRFVPAHDRPVAKRIVAIGRLIPLKGPLEAISAFARVVESHPDAHFDVIGDGPLRQRCIDHARELGVSERVHFHLAQPVDRVVELLQGASVFIQHGMTQADGAAEAFGLAPLEAGACGLPVVVTRHGGMAETVVDGQTGMLVAEGDIDGMAQEIAELIADPARAQAMGAAGRERVLTHYDQGDCCRRLAQAMNLAAKNA